MDIAKTLKRFVGHDIQEKTLSDINQGLDDTLVVVYNRLRKRNPEKWKVLPISAMCKLVSSTVTYPYEVFRTQLRIVHGRATLKNAIRNNEWSMFYNGIYTHIIKTIPNTMALFFMYECLKN